MISLDTFLFIILPNIILLVIIIIAFRILLKNDIDWSPGINKRHFITWLTWPFKLIWPDTKTIKRKMTNDRPSLS